MTGLDITFCYKKRRSLFPERNEQFKISRIYISLLEDMIFLEFAFIIDINNQLLNLKLQRTNQNIFQLVSQLVESFRRKLQVLKSHLNDNIYYFFSSCQILLEEYDNNYNFKEYNTYNTFIF